MHFTKTLLLASAGLIILTSCTGTMENLARGYTKVDLRPVVVGDRGYAVERRTRIVDLGRDPDAPENKVVSVLANVAGRWVYCGVTRDGCEEAIERQLIKDRRSRRM